MFSDDAESQGDHVSHSTTPQVLDVGTDGQPSAFGHNCQGAIFSTSLSKDIHDPKLCTDPIAGSSAGKEFVTQSQDCASITALTFSTLDSLRIDFGACSAIASGKSDHPTPTIEQVLITNKAAMQSIDTILACPCSLNPHYALTLALMCHKILVRYEAIVNTTPNGHLVAISDPSCAGKYAATPITVGAYKIDAADERRIIIQLIINEVRNIKVLLERYEEKSCVAVNGSKNRREGIYSALETFLRSDLSQIRVERKAQKHGQRIR